MTPYFVAIPHLARTADDTKDVHPLSFLVEISDLLGRAQLLQSQSVDPSDHRAVDVKKDANRALLAAAIRWYEVLGVKNQQDSSSLLVVSR
jgi:hypothetical protein